MKNKDIDFKFAATGVTSDEVRNQAESNGVKLLEGDLEKIADFLLTDEVLFAARQEAINRALEHTKGHGEHAAHS